MSSAADRELREVKALAEAPRGVRLGCVTVSHTRLGFCAFCTPPTPTGLTGLDLEVNGWRLLALGAS